MIDPMGVLVTDDHVEPQMLRICGGLRIACEFHHNDILSIVSNDHLVTAFRSDYHVE